MPHLTHAFSKASRPACVFLLVLASGPQLEASPAAPQSSLIKASNPEREDAFLLVDMSEETLVVGAPGEDSPSSGIDGPQGNAPAGNGVGDIGAAYVFVRAGDTWEQQAYVKASNPDQEDRFGQDVAISGDTLIVGASSERSLAGGVNGDQLNNSGPGSGAVYVFVRQGTTWSQQAYLKAAQPDRRDFFGSSIAIEGDRVVVGAYAEDGSSTGVNGDESDDTKEDSGAVYVFERTGTTWAQTAYIKASNADAEDHFGSSVVLEGGRIAVGARRESGASSGVGGNASSNGRQWSGAVYTYVLEGSNWVEEAYIKASNPDDFDSFGGSVALAGDVLLVGAPGEMSGDGGLNGDQLDNTVSLAGAVYAFSRQGGVWAQEAYIKSPAPASNRRFGNRIAFDSGLAVISDGINGNSVPLFYSRTGGTWAPKRVRTMPFGEEIESFAYAALDGEWIALTTRNDSQIPGVHSCLGDTAARLSGGVYMLERHPVDFQVVCGPNEPNSSSLPASLEAYGSGSLSDNNLTLRANNLPPNTIGMVISSRTPGFIPGTGGSQGNLCLGGGSPIGRHDSLAELGASGTKCWFDLTLDLTAMPSPSGPQAVMPGETWYFQTWYRDVNPTSTSNFTHAVSLTF